MSIRFGHCTGYTGQPCSNCGRYRVEHFEGPYLEPEVYHLDTGYDICEKCRWCSQLSRYILDDEFYIDDDIDRDECL